MQRVQADIAAQIRQLTTGRNAMQQHLAASQQQVQQQQALIQQQTVQATALVQMGEAMKEFAEKSGKKEVALARRQQRTWTAYSLPQ